MRLSAVATVGIVLVGVAGVTAWTHFDQAAKLRNGEFKRYATTVVSVVSASSAQHGGIAVLRWTDAADGQARDGGAFITSADFAAQRYKAGDSLQAWVHPGMSRPVLSEAKPDLQPDQSFTAIAAAICLAIGVALVGYAFKTGQFITD
ncbi:MAG: hypothetical protein EXR77_17280 [Myxococcales bacterium]|nr:hypothetical protein [Myxococcales bacterium]